MCAPAISCSPPALTRSLPGILISLWAFAYRRREYFCSMRQVGAGLISRAVRLALPLCLLAGTAASTEQEPIVDNPLIVIPGGSFIFGRDDANDNERPRRELTLPSFQMNETEITNAQYERFVQATGHRQ